MRSFLTSLAVLAACAGGCLKHEIMTQDEVLKYNPRPDEIKREDEGVLVPRPETCLEAGRMYEALYKDQEDVFKKRDFAWRAKKAYQQANTLNPKLVAAIAGLARMDELEGNVNGAAQLYSRCLSQITGNQPGDAAILYEAGMFFARQKQFDQAIQILGQAMRTEPGNRTYAMNFGFTLARAGRFDESYRHFMQITTPAEAGYQVALMAKHIGNVDVARQYGTLAIQANPQQSQNAQALMAELQQSAAATANPPAAQPTIQQAQHSTDVAPAPGQ